MIFSRPFGIPSTMMMTTEWFFASLFTLARCTGAPSRRIPTGRGGRRWDSTPAGSHRTATGETEESKQKILNLDTKKHMDIILKGYK